MRTRLIVLTDFSPNSETLLELAGAWCKVIEANIVLVHRISGRAPALTDNANRQRFLDFEKGQAMAELEAMAKKASLDATKITYHIFYQDFINSLPLLLKPGFHNLILVGLKGTGLLKQIFLGSTIIEIIEDMNLPVIAAPFNLKPAFPKKAVIALSHRYPLNENAFVKVLSALQKQLQQIELLSIITPNDSETEINDYLNQLKTKFPDHFNVSVKVYKAENPFEEIKTYMQQDQQSILVIQKGPRTLSDQLFRKFLVNDMVYDGATPLIIIPS